MSMPRVGFERGMTLAIALCAIACAAIVWGGRRIEIIEALKDPVSVRDWSEEGLRLADGRTVPLPGFRKLPVSSDALTEATQRGVEIRPDGRVFGLVRAHHWCGNDRVKRHIARVDLSHVLLFVNEGEPAEGVASPGYHARVQGGDFSECGWRINEFSEFAGWSRTEGPDLASQRASTAAK